MKDENFILKIFMLLLFITFSITLSAQPNAGPDQTVCTNQATLAAGALQAGETGTWVILMGNGTFANANLPNTTISNLGQGENVLRWTVTGGASPGSDQVSIINNTPSNSNAGSDRVVCSSTTFLSATAPSIGVGMWSVLGGSGTIANVTSSNTTVSNLGAGANYFLWRVTNGTCLKEDYVTLTNSSIIANAGGDQVLCSEQATMDAVNVSGATGTWSVVFGTGSFSNVNSNQTQVLGLSPGTNLFRWSITNTACTSSDEVTVTSNFFTVDAGSDFSTCETTAVLQGEIPTGSAYGLWTNIGASTLTITNATLHNTTITNIPVGVSTLRWTLSKNGCTSSDNVVITNNYIDLYAPSNDIITCDDEIILSIFGPDDASYQWNIVSGGGMLGANYSKNISITNLQYGVSSFQVHASRATCEQSEMFDVTSNYVVASAGEDKVACSPTYTVVANTPLHGSGTWSVAQGSGSISNVSTISTTVSGLSQGINKLVWKINNFGCYYTDTVVVDYHNFTVSAGSNQSLCNTTTTLYGNNPLSISADASGYWSVQNGNSTILNSMNYSTQVNNLSQGINTFRWEISDASCSKYDDVDVTNNLPTTANAGIGEEVCENTTTLNANLPVIGVGVWSVVSGGATIVTPSNYTTTVTNMGLGANIFRWTISNNGCTSDHQVTVYNNSFAVYAGVDQTQCINITTLNAQPISGGFWSVAQGDGSFANNTSYNTTVSNIMYGANIFRWQASSGECTAFDEVVVSNYSPSNASAGTDQSICNSTTTLVANNPSIGTGTWNVASGSGTIVSPSNYQTAVSNIGIGANTFRWTINNQSCSRTDYVVVTRFASDANAGADQALCSSNTTLNASPANGEWSFTAGYGTLVDNTLANTTVTSLENGANTLRWTVTNNACNGFDEVVITNNSATTAFAGEDRFICENSTGMNGNPPIQGVGLWTVNTNGTIIQTPSLFNSAVSNLASGVNIFRWRITNLNCNSEDYVNVTNNRFEAMAGGDQNICNNFTVLNANNPAPATGVWTSTNNTIFIVNSTLHNTAVQNLGTGVTTMVWTVTSNVGGTSCINSDEMFIYNNGFAAFSIGEDISVCEPFAELNAPYISGASGVWSVVSGGGNIENISANNTLVTNLMPGTSTFRWSIANGQCTAFDDINVTNNSFAVSAGADIQTCNTYAMLNAPNPAPYIGYWTILGGGANITNSTLHNTTVTNLNNGVNIFRWTVNANGCMNFDEVSVYSNAPSQANAGENFSICEPQTTLIGNAPLFGNGLWSVLTGSGNILSPSSTITDVVNIGLGANVFQWKISLNNCESTDNVVVTNQAFTIPQIPDKDICFSQVMLNAPLPANATGTWSIVSGTGFFANINSPQTMFSNIGQGANTVQWTVNQNGCTAQTQAVITNNSVVAQMNFNINGNEVAFTDVSQGVITDYHWTFGDGAFAHQQNTIHVYQNAGMFTACHSVMNVNNGCQNTVCSPIEIGGNYCNAEFEFTVNNNTVSFTDISTGGTVAEHYWTFGDGNVANVANPIHTYNTGGFKAVTLYIVTENGCTSQKMHEVNVGNISCNINAEFNYFVNPNSLEVTFQDETEGDVNKWFWIFGNGNTSALQNPTFTFPQSGVYLVRLTARDTINNCLSNEAHFVQVGEIECMADFIFVPEPETNLVYFTNFSMGNVDTYMWNFGDGLMSSEKDPEHLFTTTGMYPVTLTVSDNAGLCMASKTLMVQVGAAPCNADFTYFVNEDNSVNFQGIEMGDITNRLWLFGDGEVKHQQQNPTHQYEMPGIYPVTYTIFNNSGGCQDVKQMLVIVNQTGDDCEADFMYQLASDDNAVMFFDASIGNIVSWFWDFNDGGTATVPNPLHQFTSGGYHNVCLTVTNAEGIVNTYCTDIQITDNCYANFTTFFEEGNSMVTFADQSFGSIDSWLWNFGDGTTATEQNVTHSYPELGFYLAKLTVQETANGCISEKYGLVNAGSSENGFQIDFSATQNSKGDEKEGYPTDFIASTIGNPPVVQWNFGDNSALYSTSNSPTHVYETTGVYEVCVTANDPLIETQSTKCRNVEVVETGVNLLDEMNANMQLFPIPASDILHIEYNIQKAGNVSLTIYDALGNKINSLFNKTIQEGTHSVTIDVSSYFSGNYFVVLQTPQGSITTKFIIVQK